MAFKYAPLPIDDSLEKIVQHCQDGKGVVIVAEPGSGKTTRVPVALMDAAFLANQRILVLQPRRVAARSTAMYIARQRATSIGGEVGYRVRFDNRTSTATRLEILTEGLLVRQLQSDPLLNGVGCVIFDEFHERSLNTDLGLAMVREIQESLRPDLKIVIMSATLDPLPISRWLGLAVITVPGRVHPVEITHTEARPQERAAEHVARISTQALSETRAGHILVFLPGVADIERVNSMLMDRAVDALILPFHGRLTPSRQDQVFVASTRRKIILATNIAETSITIEDVTVVIDSGLARQPKFDRAIGMERLETVRIDRHSADQRTGRAGRTGPGRCYRLWSKAEDRGLMAEHPAEIHRADLTQLVLQVRVWGSSMSDFVWFEAPKEVLITDAEHVLMELGALDAHGVTSMGHRMVQLPLHPRLARVMLSAEGSSDLDAVATMTALITERDILQSVPDIDDESDLDIRLEALERYRSGRGRQAVSSRAIQALERVRDDLLRYVSKTIEDEKSNGTKFGLLDHFLAGFPDRVAQRRGPNSHRFVLANGSGARLHQLSVVKSAPYILALSVRGARRGQRGQHSEHMIHLAAAVDPTQLPTTVSQQLSWDATRSRVQVERVFKYRNLVLKSMPDHGTETSEAASLLLASHACTDPNSTFGLDSDSAVYQLVTRCEWLRQNRPDLNMPELTILKPSPLPSQALIDLCHGKRDFKSLRSLDLVGHIKGILGYEFVKDLDALAPSHLILPDGSNGKLEYAPDKPAILATRFERLFGLSETPTIAGTPVMLHLLAPNMRPVQITQDLANFWHQTYPQIRKELRGRYPRHPWPEDPLAAKPGIYRKRRQ